MATHSNTLGQSAGTKPKRWGQESKHSWDKNGLGQSQNLSFEVICQALQLGQE